MESAPRPRTLAGAATPAATAAHCAGLSAGAATALGTTGLVVTRLGFGGYRVDDATPAHRAALEMALTRGVNLVDTSTNYTDGGSERLVGSVLAGLTGSGRLDRSAVVVVSKIGYVQGANLALAREREAEGRPFPEMVRYMEGCWHCVHPGFLADQLVRSRGRLGLETLDVVLLHNPEYFLSDAKRRGPRGRRADSWGELPRLRDEFYRRLAEAFGFFEDQVRRGAIGWYGVSSNTVTAPTDGPEATSLARMLDAARAAGGEHHRFRVLQLPMNLLEAGALLEPNTGPDGRETALECARREGIGVLVNRPLNAIVGGRLIRLADPVAPDPAPELRVALADLAELEREWAAGLGRTLAPGLPGIATDRLFDWAHALESFAPGMDSLAHWRDVERQALQPRVAAAVEAVDRAAGPGGQRDAWEQWRARYLAGLDTASDALAAVAATASRRALAPVKAALARHAPGAWAGETLSGCALAAIAGTPGVTTVLVGMREPGYVDDALRMLGWPPPADPRPLFAATATLAAVDDPARGTAKPSAGRR